jgi:hypothetical protein
MPQAELTRRALPLQLRDSALQPSSWNAEARTIEVIWTTGAIVRRRDFWTGAEYDEELVVSPAAVDMSRFEAGAVQVLDAHDRHSGVRSILGIVVNAWLSGGQGHALLRLSEREDLAGIVADIGAGIIRNVSFGYSVERYEVIPARDRGDGGDVPLYRAVRLTPQEISFVPVGADLRAGTRSAPQQFPCDFTQPSPEQTMPTTTTDPTDQHDAELRSLVQRARLPATYADTLIARGLDLDAARAAIVDELGMRDRAAGGHLNVRPGTHGPAAEGTAQEQMLDALVARMGGQSLQRENQYRHARVADMARDMLEMRGVRTSGLAPDRLIERALHSTSDFPELLQGAGQRVLRQAYGAYEGGLKRACKPSTSRDFRAKQALMLGEWPELLKVGEHSEFKFGSMAEVKSSYALVTYGRIFGITRQALVNDDLDAFADMSVKIGRAAAEVEAKVLVTLLTSNPVMSDSVALFHADHGNLGTGAGSALQLSALTTARTAMRLQKGTDGTTAIDATPAYLIVPAALETTAEQLLATLQPTQVSQVNPFSGKLELVVDPRLDAASATAWYLATNPAVLETIEYAYLESAGGPEVIVREGFEIDGLQMKGRLDFGAGVMDWRGLYRANGA